MSPGQRRRGRKDGRDIAEVVTLVLSIIVVAVLVGGVAAVELTSDRPPALTAEIALDAVRSDDGRFYLPVTVRNDGDQAAEAVLVVVVVRIDDREVEHELLIDYLAGHGSADGVAVLGQDPRGTEVTVEVRSFLSAD